jgi:phage-related protein
MSIPVYFTAQADLRPKIIDTDGNEFYLPATFNVRSEPISRKSSILELAFAHGGRDVSDGKVAVRTVEVSGKLWAATDAEFNAAWDALAAQIMKDDIILQDRGRQITANKIVQTEVMYPSQVDFRYGEVSLQLQCLDPFWYAIAAKTKVFAIGSSPLTVGFELLGNVEAWPTITIEHSASNTDFTLKSVTDGNRSIRIQDSGALAGQTTVIDCQAGTVTRGGVDKISTMSGLFLRLLGGRPNSLEYTGANCTITFAYKEAWL